ncbi:MAG: nuclear transport factor 2 family protein [Candidatus Brevundimonas phytovorans]|nr:nuclear transport factor 2 family protein [Brevundimonas sp.]WEK56773.1 MAG: nuclear transport factor 2 family protein [Brevundimonas sp.]
MSLTPQSMMETVEAYIAAFDRADAQAVAALYALDAEVRDPADAEPIRGRDAIHAFYAQSMATGARLRLDGPVRVVGSVAAFAFSVHLNLPQGAARIDVIDTFEFNPDGLIARMTAYWGPNNMHGFLEQA